MSYIKQNKIKGTNIYMILVSIILIIYAIIDMQTSTNSGIKEADRSMVYVFLAVTIFLMGSYKFSIDNKLNQSTLTNMMMVLTGWVIFVNVVNSVSIWAVMTHIGLSVWWISSYGYFYKYLNSSEKSLKYIKLLFVFMFCFYFISFFYALLTFSEKYNNIPVLNISYYILVFSPLIFISNSRSIKIIGFIATLIIIGVSMKRGAIVAFPFMIAAMFLTDAIIKKKGFKSFVKIIGILILFFVVLLIANHFSGGFLFSRFGAEQLAFGSNRSTNYSAAFRDIMNRSLLTMLTGKGSGSSELLLGTGVHNEWLEFGYSFGIIGVIIYLFFIGAIIKKYLFLVKNKSIYASAYSMALVYIIIIGMVGGIYFVHSTFYIMAFFGIVGNLSDKEIASRSRGNDEKNRIDNFSQII